MSIEYEYLRIVKEGFNSVKKLGDKTIQQLAEEEIHWSLNEESNSIVVIVKHLCGNMVSRWTNFLHSDGEKPDRNRDQEFFDDLSSKKEMIRVLDHGWSTLFEALNHLEAKDLLKTVNIRGESHLVIEAIERQVAHYSYHIGQIVYIGKQMKGKAWESLSIPMGKSEEYLETMLKKHKPSE